MGVLETVGAIVDNSVGAGQTHAQDPAHGVTMPGTHAQDSASTHEQNPAHLRKELTTKKKPPPTNPTLAASVDHSRRTTRSHDCPVDGPEQLDTFVGVIRSALPDQLRLQLNTSTLRAKAEALANAGWTEQALAAAVIDREWEGRAKRRRDFLAHRSGQTS